MFNKKIKNEMLCRSTECRMLNIMVIYEMLNTRRTDHFYVTFDTEQLDGGYS